MSTWIDEIDASVGVGLESLCAHAGMAAEDYEGLLASIPFCVAWIAWSETYAIKWHSGGLRLESLAVVD